MRNIGINIKADREYFHEILNHIASGKYAVPVFQRDFVWSRSQIIDLFDSILNGYPIGTILLWKPPADETFRYKDILSDRLTENHNAEYCILDGRQRLTAFYGCVSPDENKKDDFCLYYDLEKEELTYTYSRYKKWLWRLSDIFDTFALLKKSQLLLGEQDAQTYIDRARKINSDLQQYVVGEIIINDGSLEEAQVAFTRLNSKGTPISDWDMVQALSYDSEDDRALNESLNELRQSLQPCGFQDIKEDEILACCYKYAGRKYLEKVKDLEKVEVKSYLDDVGRDLRLATRFLHDECFIFSPRLFPYAKQIVPLCYFFKCNASPTEEQKRELKRWVLYTIYTQQLAGSLTVLRQIFERFDEFAEGQIDTANDEYKPVELPRLDFSFSTGTAKSSFLLLTMIRQRLRHGDVTGRMYIGNYTFVTKDPAGVMPLVDANDYQLLRGALRERRPFDYNAFCLTEEMVNLLSDKDYDTFLSQRAVLLCQKEEELLIEHGITIENN